MKQAYLFICEGPRSGAHFPLDADNENLVGRGLECQIVVDDRQCSRIHACFEKREDDWWVTDTGSHNGTLVDGERVSKVALREGNQIKIGATVFTFGLQDPQQSIFAVDHPDTSTHRTVVLQEYDQPSNTSRWAFETLRQQQSAEDVYFIFELSICLLSTDDPDEVIRQSLSKLMQRTGANAAGFLWVNDLGELTPKLVIPAEAADKIKLTASITELVAIERKGVRMDHRDSSHADENQEGFADSICVPLVDAAATLGAIHLYRETGRFGDNDLQLSQAVAAMTVRSLVRARRHSQLSAEHHRLLQVSGEADSMIGDSKPMADLKKKIKRVAAASGCVLVRGESGAGKELVARALYKSSSRADRPMLSVNCAAIPHDLMESQLFGHKKGAFTGADADHIGWFQQADAGTLFLDEVGELTLEGQAKLLRILEGHPFLPVGGKKEVCVDVRVICATNRDLADLVAEKKFREDLFYRLSVFELLVPPLRDRGADIGKLIDHFMSAFAIQHGRMYLRLSDEAREKLLGYQWPGNVRQLRNVIDSAVVMAEGNVIQPEDLGIRDVDKPEVGNKTLRLDHWERELIKEALERSEGNVPQAAKLLGTSRATLYRKIEEYGIKR